jgi:predicted O-methyltransferase YrrM
VSAAYQAAAMATNGGGRLTTIEGDPEQAKIAGSNLAELGLDASIVIGRFQDVLAGVLDELAPIDYAFVDGHHERNATLAYFEQLLPALQEGAIVVFDDISWSDGMKEAWSLLSEHPRVAVAVDLIAIGVCVVRSAFGERERYRLLVTPALDLTSP